MIKIYLAITLMFQFSHAERSMFGAGDLDSSSPYGLTNTEKVIVKNKQILKQNEKRIKKVDLSISELNQRVDGIESLLEGEGKKLNSTSINLNKYKKRFTRIEETQIQDRLKVEQILKDHELQIEANSKNILVLKESMDKIVRLVNEINNKYVSKKEFDNLISLLDKKQQPKKTDKKSRIKKPTKSNKILIKEVRVLFKKDHFTKALPILDYLIKKNYRPAECNYYMGDINYYRKKYKNALYYFKKSMTLYDKADYIPKLLLHSAISFDKLGDDENAQNFYNTLVDIYPDTKEAKTASNKIK